MLAKYNTLIMSWIPILTRIEDLMKECIIYPKFYFTWAPNTFKRVSATPCKRIFSKFIPICYCSTGCSIMKNMIVQGWIWMVIFQLNNIYFIITNIVAVFSTYYPKCRKRTRLVGKSGITLKNTITVIFISVYFSAIKLAVIGLPSQSVVV